MTILTFANSKGGVGKSTLCALVASELAPASPNIHLIDADVRQFSCFQWVNRCRQAGTLPESITASKAATQQELVEAISKTGEGITLIDVQGSMNELLTAAIVASDLTIVPAKGNVMEMFETIKLFEWAHNLKRAPLRLVLNRVEGIDLNTKAFQDAIELIRAHKLPTLPTFIRARKIYEQFYLNSGTLEKISEDPSKAEQVKKGRANIVQLLNDITEAIKADELPADQSKRLGR
jgi:chromosome partitioning protein